MLGQCSSQSLEKNLVRQNIMGILPKGFKFALGNNITVVFNQGRISLSYTSDLLLSMFNS